MHHNSTIWHQYLQCISKLGPHQVQLGSKYARVQICPDPLIIGQWKRLIIFPPTIPHSNPLIHTRKQLGLRIKIMLSLRIFILISGQPNLANPVSSLLCAHVWVYMCEENTP